MHWDVKYLLLTLHTTCMNGNSAQEILSNSMQPTFKYMIHYCISPIFLMASARAIEEYISNIFLWNLGEQ